jgi:hypothetical protein
MTSLEKMLIKPLNQSCTIVTSLEAFSTLWPVSHHQITNVSIISSLVPTPQKTFDHFAAFKNSFYMSVCLLKKKVKVFVIGMTNVGVPFCNL